ncbi:ImmA/IrrE family metallo-endopeptidase [Fusobacterium ulcerans]|uniref:ImmA/IrrE family metallo-endopeptidase n=1 Tax=Fusobacterium ulcerans TaxID=861 RepID=UPI00102FFCDB|nr:ImmA/IrrE family metallo-endopeptidase [Fusobacterium ulcerans]
MINIPRRVSNLIKKWETRNPFLLCKYLKIDIMYRDLGEIKGYYKKSVGKKIIVLNEKLDEFSLKVVLAHELGHALLHTSKEINFMKEHHLLPKSSIWEYEANKFAAELLIDEEMEYEYLYEVKLNIKVLEELKSLKLNSKFTF